MLDVPTQWADGGNGRGNYAVINPLNNSGGVTISDGNLKALWASASDRSVLSTFPIPSTGKFYAEFVNGTLTSASVAVAFGLATEGSSRTGMIAANMWVYYASNQSFISRNGTLSSQIGTNQTIAACGILQVAIDRDNNQAWLGYNNVWVNATNGTTGDPSAGTNPTVSSLPTDLFVMVGLYAENGNVNFGQRPFAYTPPTGFKALNTLNLPEPTISNGANYMAATTYTGTGSSLSVSNAVNGVSFQPDFVWTKPRSTAVGHTLFDSLRGVTKYLQSNTTGAEGTAATSLTAFNSDGFTVNSDTSTGANGVTYIGWQWKEGATQGFDIVTYTGTGANRTVSHALGVAPSMLIFKPRNAADNWPVWHKAFAVNEYVYLNLTNAKASLSTFMNSTLPDSSNITLGTWANTNANTQTMVCYAFSEVAGFSKAFSYTGNGSADGPFIFTGFRPRFILIKESTPNARGWRIFDTARSPSNQAGLTLSPNAADAEDSGSGLYNQMDILSNGFKLRAGTNSEPTNESGATYVGFAWAEVPFKNSLAR